MKINKPFSEKEREKQKKAAKTAETKDKLTLKDIIIQDITQVSGELSQDFEPFQVYDEEISQISSSHLLTKENISSAFRAEYKRGDDWFDVYMLEFKAGTLEEDFPGLLVKERIMEKVNKKEYGTTKFLVKDDLLVLINNPNKGLEYISDRIFEHYRENIGMKRVKPSYEMV